MGKPIFFFLGSLKLGGTEVVASRIEKGLTARGYEVYFVLLKNTIEIPVSSSAKILYLNTEKYQNRIIKILYAYFGLWSYYLKYKPKRIISFSSGLNILLLFTFLPNQVFTVDTNLFWVKSKLYRRRFLKLTGFLPFVKKVIVPSNELRIRFKSYLNNKSYSKFETIYNPVPQPDVNQSTYEYSGNYLVSVGRLNRFKGYEQLIKCFAKANFEKDVSLLILGSGPLKKRLEELIAELKVEGHVKLLGYVTHPYNYISSSQALILNSSFESFGNVLVEGLTLGVPVISNDCDFGPREIITHGKNGLLYDKSKDEELIEVLESYFNNEELRENLKKHTSYKLERFETQKITEEWIEKIIQ